MSNLAEKIETKIPTGILINIMYRDGANWKSSETFLIPNSEGLSEEVIQEAFDDIGEDEVLSMQWGLPSMAPISHPAESAGPDDHCYNEIQGITYLYDNEKSGVMSSTWDNDISVVVEAVKNNGTPDWFAFETYVEDKLISESKQNLLSQNYVVMTKSDSEELATRTLPHGIDMDLLLKVASVALTNNNLIEFLQKNDISDHKALINLQAGIANAIL